MAETTLLRDNLQSGTTGASITNVGTTLTFANAPGWASLNSSPAADQYRKIRVESEVMYVTAYTAAATTCTVARGKEGTSAVAHNSGVDWEEPPTADDMAGGTQVGLWFPVTPLATVGTWALDGPNRRLHNEATNAVNDSASFAMSFEKGTYRFDLHYRANTDAGRVNLRLGGLRAAANLSGSAEYVEGYAAAPADAVGSITGIVVPQAGVWRVSFTLDDKHASSTDYIARLYGWTFTRTA